MKKSALAVFAAIFALSLASCGTSAAEEQNSAETLQITVAETAAEITETETETETTTAETTSETTEATTTVTETEKVCTCESEFQHACCEYMNELSSIAGGVYYGDINGDDMPEAIVEITPFQFTYVLYENENGMQVLKLPTESDRGRVGYIADTMQILFNPCRTSSWISWGYEEYYIYSWNGTDYEETASVYREAGIHGIRDGVEYSELGQAYIDGEEVDNDTFEIKLAEFEKLRTENGYFPFVKLLSDENFESYLLENFPCFDNWDAFPVKEGSL